MGRPLVDHPFIIKGRGGTRCCDSVDNYEYKCLLGKVALGRPNRTTNSHQSDSDWGEPLFKHIFEKIGAPKRPQDTDIGTDDDTDTDTNKQGGGLGTEIELKFCVRCRA